MQSRSIRRWLKEKRKKLVTKYYPDYKEANKLADNPHPCSGPCCGNPRHHFKGKDKVTLQEQKADLEEF